MRARFQSGRRQRAWIPSPRRPRATRENLALALALTAATRAFEEWPWSSPLKRSRILRHVAALIRERADQIARDLTRNQGKPLSGTRNEVCSAARPTEWHAEECRRIDGRVIPSRTPSVRQTVVRQPVGVCASFTLWNFPFDQALRKITAALAAGYTLIIKPAEEAPSSVVALARLFAEAGLPPECLNAVWGMPAPISTWLIQSPIVRKVSLTSSIAVGKQPAALSGAHMKRVTMEIGGHSPVLIYDDVDIERAAPSLARLKTLNAGQACMAPSRFYDQKGVFDAFTERFTDALSTRVLGDGLNAATCMGPLAHKWRVNVMEELASEAFQHGATLVTGAMTLS